MSDETIDVLAVMGKAMTQVRHCHEAHEIQEARKAIAELIEACKERNEAEGEYGAAEAMYGPESNAKPMRAARGRMIVATKRYVAALARVGATK